MHEAASKKIFDSEVGKITKRICQLRGWTIHSRKYPVFDVSFSQDSKPPLRVRMICDGWDEQPPSIQFLSLDGELLSTIQADPAGVINNSAHPNTGYPFICSIGSREYHTHSSHITDLWASYRGQSSFDLGGILTKVWRAWRNANQ